MTKKKQPRRTRTETTKHSRLFRLAVCALLFSTAAATAQDDKPQQKPDPKHEPQPDQRRAYARAPYAVIFATLWGPANQPVYGVHMQLRRAGEKKVRWEAYSDHHGEFAFRVPPGKQDYELTADPKSLKSLKINGLTNREPVKVHVEYDEQVDTGVHLTQ